MIKTADVVVVGGGIQGLSNAYFLSKSGLKVVLVEQGDLAFGTTSRSDGDNFISDSAPGYMTSFSSAAVNLIVELSKTLDYDIDWMEKGCLLLAETEAEMESARIIYKQKLEAGVGVRLMNQYEVHEDEPNTADDIPGALEFSKGGSLNPMLLAFALGQYIKKMGGELLRFHKVIGFKFDEKGAINTVITDQVNILTQNVVLAAGIWSTEIARLAGLEIPVTTMKGDLLVVEPGTYITRRKTMELGYNLVRNEDKSIERSITPFMKEHGIGFLVEPTNSHNALIGFSKYPANSVTSNNLVTRAIAKRAMRFFPVVKDMNIIRTFSGLRPWTPDHEPIVSKTRIPGFYLCTGHCGNGITYGPLSGMLITQLICNETTEFEMSRLSIERFSSVKKS